MFPMQPWRDVVEVYGDPVELLGVMRTVALFEIMAFLQGNELMNTSDVQLELLRKLKVTLKDTGLTEYPEDPEVRERILNEKV